MAAALQPIEWDRPRDRGSGSREQTDVASSDGDCLLLALPGELLWAILGAFPNPEVPGRMAPVARRLHALSRDDALWRCLYKRRYGPPMHDHFVAHGKDWRWLYRARSQRGAVGSTGPGCVAVEHNEGCFYCGDLERGVPHGYGLKVRVNAQDVVSNGVDPRGAFARPACSRAEGLWADGQPHGHTVVTSVAGNRYEGECAGGLRHGQGTFTCPGNFTYRGAYVDGVRKGWGVLCCASGHRYEGQWERGGWNGEGTLVLPDGRSHHGQWQLSTPHGRGVHVWPNGQRVEGTWSGGSHPCGRAALIAADGRRFVDDADEVFCVGGVTVPDGVDLGGGIKRACRGPTDGAAHPTAFGALYLDGSRLLVECLAADQDRTRRVLAHSQACTLAGRPIEQGDGKDPTVGTCMACLLACRAQGQTDSWYDVSN
ncbi:Morn repeat incomplete domain containing protein [Pandoravirus dulcis]|uniref:Morn repeat incomplete domain containing protein n=1 Tax=Pandoravirus dulcis TaxID=1349409 RepID=S4VSY9_9VIRU|nr:Morn repeat incomplete domain containing protein [Pandoravirus dulcis]AGO82505.1 Morn repeat incomplete domain containing protein [Pandoravirus dulcis]